MALKHRRRETSLVNKIFNQTLTAYILSSVAYAIGPLVDGAVIGHYLGVDAMAAYGMSWPVILIFSLIGGIIAGGSRNLYTEFMGHGEQEKANRIFTDAHLISLIFSLIMMLVTFFGADYLAGLFGAKGAIKYLRPLMSDYLIGFAIGVPAMNGAKILSSYMSIDNDGRRNIYSVICMTITNVIADLLVIHVFNGGMFLLGFATSIGNMVYFLVLAMHFLRKRRILRFYIDHLIQDTRYAKDILINGAPTGMTRVASAISGILINHMIASAGSNIIAAYSTQKSVTSLFSATYLGVADTVWILSSIYYGEEDKQALNQLQLVAMTIGEALVGAISIFLIVLPGSFAGIYVDFHNVEAFTYAKEAVRCLGFSLPLCLIVYSFDDYLMGTKHLHAANIYSFLLECGVLVPTVYLMTKVFGGRGVWFALPLALGVMELIAGAYILKYGTGEYFSSKRLLLKEGFGTEAGRELSIEADSMFEVIGMSRLAGLFCQENGIEGKRATVLALCIEEMAGNIIEHGFDDGKAHTIDIRLLVKDDELILRIRDDCIPFNPLERYEMTKVQDDPTKNMGIRMVMGLAKDVKYYSVTGTNNLIIKI